MTQDEDGDYRLYWNHPRLIAQLPADQKKKVLESFFQLVEKSKKENERRNSKIMRERNEKWAFFSK